MVGVGLGLTLVLSGLMAVWTIQESTITVYRDRVRLAESLAERINVSINETLELLQHEAAALRVETGQPLTEEQQLELANVQPRVGALVSLAVTDSTGDIVWAEPTRSQAGDGQFSASDLAQLVAVTGQPHVGSCSQMAEPASSHACLAVLLNDLHGQRYGVLLAEFDPTTALPSFPVDERNDVMRVELIHAGASASTGDSMSAVSGSAGHLQLLDPLVVTGKAGYRIHEPSHGPVHVVAYAPIPRLPAWGIIVEQPRDTVLELPNQLRQRLFAFGASMLVLAMVVAWLDVRQIVRPLRGLTAAAERISEGHLDTPVTLKRNDELGILANAFETMRVRLRTSLAEVEEWNRELERRVAAQTAEAEARNRELARLYSNVQERERERAALLQRVIHTQEEERRRLAQELHDETSQALASLQLGLERLTVDARAPESLRALAREMQMIATSTLVEVHRLAVELRPSILDDIGLVAAVERYVQDVAARSGLIADFAAIGVEHLRLIPAAESATYRIVQGALANVLLHAQAAHISVLLERRGDKLVVVIEDDGRGFDLASVRAGALEDRLGIVGMEERASLLGATLTIETAPGAGATIFLEIPIGSNVAEEKAHEPGAHPAG